jgi:GTP:adenosylcobinamide-phosphate guanylyltransferase
MNNNDQYIALVLAADRTGHDSVAEQAGTACKAFVPVGGKPMIIRVLDALADCERIQSTLLCGPPGSLLPECRELEQRVKNGQVSWIENLDTPARSAAKGLIQVDESRSVLLTTADHALLTSEVVEYFLQASSRSECDATVGVIRYETIQSKFRDSQRTVIRLRDGNFCGCNLFTFNPRGRALVTFWQQAERLRKRPWQLVNRVLGWRAVWAYLLGYLTLDRALQNISDKTGIRLQPVILPFPEAGIDVDKVDDLLLVESILAGSASIHSPL